MNIFPFVSILLLIIAISTHSIIEKGRLGLFFPKSYIGYMTANRKVQGQEEKTLYEKAPKPSQKKERTEEKPDKENKNEKKKEDPLFNEIEFDSKINIWPLFTTEKSQCKDIYEITANLFRILYSSQPFFQKGMEYEILNNIIEKGKIIIEKNETPSLEKIKFDTSLLHLCWYKMLKGTKKYKREKNKGFDSILDYVEILKDKPKKIYIPLACSNLLSAIFNKDIANEIMKEQNNNSKYRAITEEKTKQIVSNNHFISKRAALWDMLTFTKTKYKNPSQSLSYTDKKTQICFKKTLHTKN